MTLATYPNKLNQQEVLIKILNGGILYCAFKIGGKQYRANNGAIVKVEKQEREVGEVFAHPDLLLVVEDGVLKIGEELAKSSVMLEVIAQLKDKKIKIFKRKRRKGHRRQMGHRQAVTLIRVLGVEQDKAASQKVSQPKVSADAAASAV